MIVLLEQPQNMVLIHQPCRLADETHSEKILSDDLWVYAIQLNDLMNLLTFCISKHLSTKQNVRALYEAKTSISSVKMTAKTNQSDARHFLLRADVGRDGPQL